METVIRESFWHDFEAMMIENDLIRMIVVPEAGGKIVSIFDQLNGREWLLVPEESHPFQKLAYGADFNTLTPGGWDEMFPTILAETYPCPGEFFGVSLPDHGELWTLPWSIDKRADGDLRMSVEGIGLPYRFSRSITLPGAQMISLHYELTNLGHESMYYVWAAHPQFACEPGMTIILPDRVEEVINVLPLEWGAEWGPPGTHNPWPEKRSEDGSSLSLNVVGSTDLRRGRKFYIIPDEPISWASLTEPSTGCSLRMEWDPVAVPYCGIWIDEGLLNSRPSVALEPTTGYYDTLKTAWANQRLAVIEPGATVLWEIAVRLNHAV